MSDRINLVGQNLKELEKLVNQWGFSSFRAKQLFNWLYNHKVKSIRQMNNLPDDLQKKMQTETRLRSMKIIKEQTAGDGTKKYLFSLADGVQVEAVYMPYQDNRRSLCLSTQAGCAMGCSFCATGLQGLERDLTAGEMIEQLLLIEAKVGAEITNLVLMGMGEPLDNYQEVLKAIKLFNHFNGLNIGMRKITLSTCGLVPQIKKLARESLQLTLAISLHAVDNELRSQLIPVNKRYPIEDLISACRYYIEQTKRRVTFEYALIAGVNDSVAEAKKLSNLLSGMLAHVNLIPINKVKTKEYSRSQRSKIDKFASILAKNNISTTIRVERGSDIDAACGQLKSRGED